MNTTTSSDFVAGRPHRSGPFRAIARSFGPIANRFAGRRWFPLWVILRHTGRTSGTPYATTVVALRTPDGFMIPLPFGSDTQWAKNLFAAGGGSLRWHGSEHASSSHGSSTARPPGRICRHHCGSSPAGSGCAST